MIVEVCTECHLRWAGRKPVHIESETVCGGCAETLERGRVWLVHGGGHDVLVCESCGEQCRQCRPVDPRLQFGDENHPASHYQKKAKPGPQETPRHGQRECEGCFETLVPTRESQRFHSRACADRNRYLETT